MGRAASCHTGVDEVPLLLCFHPSFFLAGRPLLLHSRPLGAAVAGALLLLSAQGKEQRRYGGGWEGGLYSSTLGRSACLLCPKAVLACINISSMRQMFFQMRELPQLWRISRMDFVRSGRITPDCPLPFPSIPSFCPGLQLIVLVLSSVVPPLCPPQHAYLLIPLLRHKVEGGV